MSVYNIQLHTYTCIYIHLYEYVLSIGDIYKTHDILHNQMQSCTCHWYMCTRTAKDMLFSVTLPTWIINSCACRIISSCAGPAAIPDPGPFYQ